MLVLRRKPGEIIVVDLGGGRRLEIMLVSICRRTHQVRLGLQAPEDVGIWRQELLEAAEQEESRDAS